MQSMTTKHYESILRCKEVSIDVGLSKEVATWREKGITGSQKNREAIDANTQNKRLLIALLEAEKKGISSYQAREELDIYCPTARISDLRKKGYIIHTIWDSVDTGKAKHRIARWMLMSSKEWQYESNSV